MEKVTTPQGNIAIVISQGQFARRCSKCGGTGIFWKRVNSIMTDTTAVAEDCFPCQGLGWKGKTFPSMQKLDSYIARLERARQKREEKRQAEAKIVTPSPVAAPEPAVEWKHLDAQEGDSVTITGSVSFAKSFENSWGSTTRIVSIETDEREVVKMFTSAAWAFDVDRDDRITVEGYVHSFGEYEGIPETQLKRPSRVS